MLSRSQIDRLGKSLRSEVPETLPIQNDALREYQQLCESTEVRIREVLRKEFPNIKTYSRTKASKSIAEKLIRSPNLQLSRMDDPVGLRIVGDITISEQDLIAERITKTLDVKQVKDRRIHDSNGYRALHIIARTELIHIEIQIGTILQDEWAFMFERLADTWGRQIRYGDPPEFQNEKSASERIEMVSRIILYSLGEIAEFEKSYAQVNPDETNRQRELVAGILKLESQAREIS